MAHSLCKTCFCITLLSVTANTKHTGCVCVVCVPPETGVTAQNPKQSLITGHITLYCLLFHFIYLCRLLVINPTECKRSQKWESELFQSCQHHCVKEDFTLDDLCVTWWWVFVVVSSSPPSGWTQQSSAMQSSPTSMGSLSRRLLELWVGKSFPFLDTFPQMKTTEAVINNCWEIVNMSGFLFCFFSHPSSPAPSQPLLCKFADSQRKKHAHGGFVPNGQTADLRLVRNVIYLACTRPRFYYWESIFF